MQSHALLLPSLKEKKQLLAAFFFSTDCCRSGRLSEVQFTATPEQQSSRGPSAMKEIDCPTRVVHTEKWLSKIQVPRDTYSPLHQWASKTLQLRNNIWEPWHPKWVWNNQSHLQRRSPRCVIRSSQRLSQARGLNLTCLKWNGPVNRRNVYMYEKKIHIVYEEFRCTDGCLEIDKSRVHFLCRSRFMNRSAECAACLHQSVCAALAGKWGPGGGSHTTDEY